MIIDGPDIVDLSPLSPLLSIDNLILRNSDNISSLEAFDNTIINASLQIINYNQITNLEGIHLSNDFFFLWIQDNDQLVHLDGLENLLNVSQSIKIKGNDSINSITGLENANIDSEIEITDNPNLSFCSIQSICDAIANPEIIVTISNNLTDCNSVLEVETQCQLGVTEVDFSENLSVFPNPVSSILNIETSNTISFQKATIYSLLGEKIMETNENEINLETLSSGVYFIKVSTDKGSVTKKIVKE